MQNIQRSSKNFISFSAILTKQHRCLSSGRNILLNKWNPVIRERNTDLGRHVFEAYTVRSLMDQLPDIKAVEIYDLTQGLIVSDVILSKLVSESLPSFDCIEDLFNKLGELELKQDTENLNELLNDVSTKVLSELSEQERLVLINMQHPKYILKTICDKQGSVLNCKTEQLSNGTNKVTITCGDKELQINLTKGKSPDAIERDACLYALNELFPDEFKSFQLNLSDVIPEDDIIIQPTAPRKREVILTKPSEEPFGFTIRGGEQKVVRNKQYIQQHIVTPVFISEIIPGSPAERCGLLVGDVLLGINDHSLQDCTHRQAVTSLKEFLSKPEMIFIVKHAMKELLKYEAEQKYLERQREKIREEIKSKGFGKWHEAKAKIDPEEYIMEKLKEKRRPFQAKKIRQAHRLWDY